MLLVDSRFGQRKRIHSATCQHCGRWIELESERFWMKTTGDDEETLFAHGATKEACPMEDEFDDIDRSHAPYITSDKARSAMAALKAKHGLGFLHNPGGGQFTCIDSRYPHYGFNCQITTYDDIADLAKLRKAIAEWNREEKN